MTIQTLDQLHAALEAQAALRQAEILARLDVLEASVPEAIGGSVAAELDKMRKAIGAMKVTMSSGQAR